MGEIVRLRGSSPARERPPVDPGEALRRGLLIGALAALILAALGVVVYVSRPQTPANIVAGPATPDASDDGAVFDPQVAEEQQRARLAEQEKEDGAVFGQAPSAPEYRTQYPAMRP